MTKKKPADLGKRAKNDLARLQKSGDGHDRREAPAAKRGQQPGRRLAHQNRRRPRQRRKPEEIPEAVLAGEVRQEGHRSQAGVAGAAALIYIVREDLIPVRRLLPINGLPIIELQSLRSSSASRSHGKPMGPACRNYIYIYDYASAPSDCEVVM